MSTLDPAARIQVEPGPGAKRKPSKVVPWSSDVTWSIWFARMRHPFRRGWMADAVNKYGVPVSLMRCRACGRFTWWTPAFRPDVRRYNDVCLADACPSYDPHRDVSFLLSQDKPEGNDNA